MVIQIVYLDNGCENFEQDQPIEGRQAKQQYLKMRTAASIVDSARSWLGTPFHPQGRKKGVGCDCLGLIIEIGHEPAVNGLIKHDIKIHDRCDYHYLDDSYVIKQAFDKHLTIAGPDNSLHIGDILLLQLTKTIHHLAVVVDVERMTNSRPRDRHSIIHACSSRGIICETTMPQTWYKKIIGSWRFEYNTKD